MPVTGEWRGENPERKFERMDVAVRRGLVVAGNRIRFTATSLMEAERPGTIMTGRTMRSITVSKVQRGFVGGVGGLFVTVGPTTKYALWGIGTGRRPGKPPPLRAIYRWVREKPGGAGLSEGARWAIARATQRTIAAKGTKPHHILERALAIERPNIARFIRLSIRSVLK